MAMETPSMKENQFAVGKAEYATGHVLRNDGTIYSSGQDINEMYEVFDNYIEARDFTIQLIGQKPTIECWIIDGNGNHINTYDKNGERKFS
jgi:hypothetical protein